jgi:hypothetical protein
MGTQIYRNDKGNGLTLLPFLRYTGAFFYVNPLDSNMMLAAMNSSGGRVVKSTNYGQTWTTWGPGP